MIRIGICDNEIDACKNIQVLCEKYFEEINIQYQCIFFASGEEVVEYCKKENNKRIDLLFLDIEMDGISGIEVKEKIKRQNSIWRIVFVSSHYETICEAFGLKTLGFIVKPPKQEEICKWIDVVLDDIQNDILIEIKGLENGLNEYVLLEDIEYFRAEGNYTEIVFHTSSGKEEKSWFVSKKMGDWEKELLHLPVIRVHKSYMVNMMNITYMGKDIGLRDKQEKIPIGRAYKEKVKKQYQEYVKGKVRKRL